MNTNAFWSINLDVFVPPLHSQEPEVKCKQSNALHSWEERPNDPLPALYWGPSSIYPSRRGAGNFRELHCVSYIIPQPFQIKSFVYYYISWRAAPVCDSKELEHSWNLERTLHSPLRRAFSKTVLTGENSHEYCKQNVTAGWNIHLRRSADLCPTSLINASPLFKQKASVSNALYKPFIFIPEEHVAENVPFSSLISHDNNTPVDDAMYNTRNWSRDFHRDVQYIAVCLEIAVFWYAIRQLVSPSARKFETFSSKLPLVHGVYSCSLPNPIHSGNNYMKRKNFTP